MTYRPTDEQGREIACWLGALAGANLSSADLRGAYLNGADLRRANLTGADLNVAYLNGANLSSADLRGADLTGANLNVADLRGADLTGADLRGANLSSADLRGADLTGADLSSADLRGADLTGADLRGADLTGATIGDYTLDRLVAQLQRSDGAGVLAFRTRCGAVLVRAGCFTGALADARAYKTGTDYSKAAENAAICDYIETRAKQTGEEPQP